MMQFALYSYIPGRRLRRATFEERDLCRRILAFKDGRNVYSRWAAREMARTLCCQDLTDVVIVCVPASTRAANVRRWKRFSALLSRLTGAVDGFDFVSVSGSRKRAHVTGEYELSTNIKRFVTFDVDRLRGRRVLVIDDIYTTGRSSKAFIGALEAAGCTVVMAVYLAKTRRFPLQK